MSKQICSRCIYDETVPNISFDTEGVCNYCRQIESLEAEYPTGKEGQARIDKMIEEIKAAGKGKKYDAIIGVSGGCDSSYLVHEMVTKYGLRVLAAHYDNTWNSTIATENIHNQLEKLGVDLFTIVVDNKEYDDIYRSFFRAGVRDVDCPTDIGLATTLYKAAEKFGIKYMIEGHSFRTEGVAPLGWIYMDGKYIESVQKQFGTYKLKTFPNLWFKDFLRWMVLGRIKKVRPLYYMDYDKEAAKKLLTEKYGWQWYGGHHLENRFTAFYHSYFLPTRWKIDFRIAGYSAYCRNGWMTREEALQLMQEPPHIEDDLVEYVKKRLGFSDAEFDRMMDLPKKSYKDYKTYKRTFERLRPFFWLLYKMELVPKSFYMKYTVRHNVAIRRISIGPGEVAGYFSGLKSGFDELGLPCEHFVLAANKFAYQESDYFLRSAFQAGASLSESKNNVARFIGRLWTRGVRAAVFLYALIRCDVFIFSGSNTFIRFRELPLLKLLGKKVIIVFLGSDARPPIFSGRHLDDEGAHVDTASAYVEAVQMVKKIRKIERYADVIVNHTATAQFFTRDFIRLIAVGMPLDGQVDMVKETPHHAIRILHAPSRPRAKGSLDFQKIVDELSAEGYSINFIELVGVSNSVVLQELQKCDFVIDQLYSDAPLAMFASEAAMFGKPAVVGGYYAVQLNSDNPDSIVPPSLYVEPEGIKQAIRKMLDDREFRLEMGMQAYDFIRNNWSTRMIAKNYLCLINDDIPKNWISDPRDLDYCWGWGLSKENWRKQVGEYVAQLGSDALMFNHNPKLKQKVMDEIEQGRVTLIS